VNGFATYARGQVPPPIPFTQMIILHKSAHFLLDSFSRSVR